jgi:hypothetical protein
MYRKIDERERGTLLRRSVEWEKGDEAAQALTNVGEAQVPSMHSRLAEEKRLYPPDDLKGSSQPILDRVDPDPDGKTIRLC